MAFSIQKILEIANSLQGSYFYLSRGDIIKSLSKNEMNNETMAKLFKAECGNESINCTEDTLKGFLSFFDDYSPMYPSSEFNKGKELMIDLINNYGAEEAYRLAFEVKPRTKYFSKLMENENFKRGYNIGKSEQNLGLEMDESPDNSEDAIDYIKDPDSMHTDDLIARIRNTFSEGNNFCHSVIHAVILENIKIWEGNEIVETKHSFEDMCKNFIQEHLKIIEKGGKSSIDEINNYADLLKSVGIKASNEKEDFTTQCGIKNVDDEFLDDLKIAISNTSVFSELYPNEEGELELSDTQEYILNELNEEVPISQIYNLWKNLHTVRNGDDCCIIDLSCEDFCDIDFEPSVWKDGYPLLIETENTTTAIYIFKDGKLIHTISGEVVEFNEESLKAHYYNSIKTVTNVDIQYSYIISSKDDINLELWRVEIGERFVIDGQIYTVSEKSTRNNKEVEKIVHEATNTVVERKDLIKHATEQNKKKEKATTMAKNGVTAIQEAKNGYKGAFKIGSVRGAIRFARKKLIDTICEYIATTDGKGKSKAIKDKIREGTKAFLESEFGKIFVTAAMAELINNFGTTVGLKPDMVEAASMILREEVVADGTEKLAEFGFSVGKLAKGFVTPILGDFLKLQDQEEFAEETV